MMVVGFWLLVFGCCLVVNEQLTTNNQLQTTNNYFAIFAKMLNI